MMKFLSVEKRSCKHISSNGDVITGDVIKTQCGKFREMVIYVTKYESFGSPRSILRIKPRMYADGLLPEATTTTPITT